MAKISLLPRIPAGQADGTELLPVVSDGRTMAAPVAEIVAPAAQPFVDAAAASAASAEALVGPTYESIAAGLAATVEGQTFAAKLGDSAVGIYLHQGGAAVYQRDLLTGQALQATTPGKGLFLIGTPRGGNGGDALRSTINLMEFKVPGQQRPDTGAWERAAAYFRELAEDGRIRSGTLRLPDMILPIEEQINFPVSVSLRGSGRHCDVRPTEDGVYADDFLLRLNSTGLNWASQYPNTSTGRVTDMRFTNLTTKNLRCIEAGGSYIFDEIRWSGWGQNLKQIGVYNDFAELNRVFVEGDRAPKPEWGDSGTHLFNLGIGDALRVNAIHISSPSSITRAILRVFGCRGGVIQGGINGVITLQQCEAMEIIAAHSEFGGIDVLDSNVRIASGILWNNQNINRVPIRLFASNSQYGERYEVILENLAFASTPDTGSSATGGYPPALRADVQLHSGYRTEIRNCRRVASRWTNISKHRTAGIVVADESGALSEAFNSVSPIASRSVTVLGSIPVFERAAVTGPTTTHTGINTPISLDDFAAWPLAAGTYVYQMILLVDRRRMIGHITQFGVNERSRTVEAGGSVPALNIIDASVPNMGWTARILRGTTSGQYTAVVDVPVTSSSTLPDTGSHLAGFPWVERPAGPADATNNIVGRIRYEGRNVIVTMTNAYATYLPTLGTWIAGDRIEFDTPQVHSDGRVIVGLKRLTNGSNHVNGTDWQRIFMNIANRLPGRAISAPTTITASDFNNVIDFTAGAAGFAQPAPAANLGQVEGDTVWFRKRDAGAGGLTITGLGPSGSPYTFALPATQWSRGGIRWNSTLSAWEPVL